MSKNVVLLGIVLLLATGFGVATTNVDPQTPKVKQEIVTAQKPDEAPVTFDALKKQLPKIVSNWCATINLKEPKMRITRRTSSENAKITFVAKSEFTETEFIFTLHLRFYGGVWTVMRWEAGGDNFGQDKFSGYMPRLALTIDESQGK